MLSDADEMGTCPSLPELGFLAGIESMLADTYHPIAQIWTIRAGQAAYLGHVVNLARRPRKLLDNPPSARPPGSPNTEEDAGRVGEGADARPHSSLIGID